MLDYIRIACAVPAVRVGEVTQNIADICRYIGEADARNCDLVIFPELALTGYTCQDLFFQQALLDAVKGGLDRIAECSRAHPALIVAVGLPAVIAGQMYNCAAVFYGGTLRGLVPKTFIPNYNEFYEARWFSSAESLSCDSVDSAELGIREHYPVPVGADLIFRLGDGAMLGLEICEDLWTPIPPSAVLAVSGAEIIANLSASNETVTKRTYRRELVKQQSASCACVYAFCSAGSTESTQELVFSGHSIVAGNGTVLKENGEPVATDYILVQDADLGMLRADRRKNKCFHRAGTLYGKPVRRVDCGQTALRSDGALFPLQKLPFVPQTQVECYQRCMEIYRLQVAGLKHRLAVTGANPVVNVSGDLDSLLALLVTAEAMRQLGRPMTDISSVICDRTDEMALKLLRALGVSVSEQAESGIVVSAGDLTELALGYCPQTGDKMPVYDVNASVPKTMICRMVQTLSTDPAFAAAKAALESILNTQEASFGQEDALNDFFLYYMVRFAFAPTKIYTLTRRAFGEALDGEIVKKRLKALYQGFFAGQFQRSRMPDGIKVGSVALSPRGDWRMPGDASAETWLEEVDRL